MVVSLLVLVTSALVVDPIRDAVTLGDVGEARLSQPAAYLAIAPISSILDTLTLLSVQQHVAMLLYLAAAYAVVRIWRAREMPAARSWREVIAAGLFVLGLLFVYAIAAMAPRPMAQLVLSDATVLAVDFHSHTKYSHDGRAGWDDNDVRDWHHGAGFDVAYITDHRTFEGAERGIAANPRQAGEGEGTMLLQGLEAVDHGQHLILLSAGRRYRGLTSPDLREVDDQALTLASLIPSNEPVIIQTIPDNLNKIVAAPGPSRAGARAVELIDGSPRGLAQGRRERARIVHLADSLDLALVADSDNHGWGRAAPGWTLMRIDGWRGMSSDSLARAIESALRTGRRASTKIVERRVADGSTAAGVVFAGVLVPWRMFTTLSPDERVAWLIWTWGLVILVRGLRWYRLSPSRAA